jgi:Rieske Fe-S protein
MSDGRSEGTGDVAEDASTSSGQLTRRALPAAVVVAGAVAGFAVGSTQDHGGAATGANAYGGSSGGHTGALLATVDQIPAGGGIVLSKAGIVLTKDSAGTVHAFSATCTHQGCQVSDVTSGTINCPCHGSRFDAATGAVVAGPAPSPLPPVTVAVQGNEVVTA